MNPSAKDATLARVQEIISESKDPGHFGAWTLFLREFKRFWGMAGQTILSPVVTTMLYFLVFGYSLGDRLREVQGIPYIDFLVPGLVLLGTINASFINGAFSLFIAKIHGILVDVLVTPLSYTQYMVAYTAASMVRGLMVGSIIWIVSMLMGASAWHNIPLTMVFLLLTAMAFSLIGMATAILAEEFDHVNFLPSFLITPMTFLGGVFYSISMLPEPWQTVSYLNPILYMVNGLRYGMTGISDVPWYHGMLVLVLLNMVVGVLVRGLLKSGHKLRS